MYLRGSLEPRWIAQTDTLFDEDGTHVGATSTRAGRSLTVPPPFTSEEVWLNFHDCCQCSGPVVRQRLWENLTL